MRYIKLNLELVIVFVSFFGELASQPGGSSLPNGSLPNGSLPNGVHDETPVFTPDYFPLVITQSTPVDQQHGPLPPADDEDRQRLARLASGPGVTIEPTRVFLFRRDAQTAELANAFHCEVGGGSFLLRKLPNGNYSRITYGTLVDLIPEEPAEPGDDE